jgi:LAS superfamily LD-carboxypeptidase LdcB
VMGLSNAHMEGDTDASRVYQWLVTHGHRYGRHNSYQHGLATDGYYPEKWHRRYLGE